MGSLPRSVTIALLATLVAASGPATAGAQDPEALPEVPLTAGIETREDHRFELDFIHGRFSLLAGYRQDELDWSIASPTGSPNVLSELTWDNLDIFQLTGRGSLEFPQHFLLVESSLSYGWILDGENQDSDFFGDNRSQEFSRSNNETEDDDVLDASVGFGALITLPLEETIVIKLLGGYSYHEQNLRLEEGFQTIPPLGPFPGLNSTYETQWNGPWIGIEVGGRKARGEMSLRAEYHWADYNGEANWNLRSDFAHPKSFEHDANGTGYLITLAGSYDFTDNWGALCTATYQDWETGSGTDRVFFSDGSIATTRLNEVNWESWSILLGITAKF